MAVTLTGTGGLFTRLNALGALLLVIQEQNNYGNIATVVDEFGTEYPSSIYLQQARDAIANAGWQAAQSAIQQAANSILLKMVNDDASLPDSTSIQQALEELITQMIAAPATVVRCAVAASSAAGSANSGNGPVLISALGHDGLTRRNIMQETGILLCTADSQTGGATAGSESFTYFGDPATANVFDYRWPLGSGARTNLSAVDSRITSQNLLVNSSWDTYASSLWSGWSVQAGTVATHLISDAAQYYLGTKSIRLDGDGSTLHAIAQDFGSASGTSNTLLPLTSYGVCLRMRTDSAPGAGVLRVELTDGSNVVTTDAQAANNRLSVTLSGLTTSWSNQTAVFRTPRVLPSALRLRIYCSTALSNAKNVYIDDLCFTPMDQLYAGGPLAKVFAGSSKWIKDDRHILTATNDRGGALYGASNQPFFDRLFDMKGKGLQLPDAASPSISDSGFGAFT